MTQKAVNGVTGVVYFQGEYNSCRGLAICAFVVTQRPVFCVH